MNLDSLNYWCSSVVRFFLHCEKLQHLRNTFGLPKVSGVIISLLFVQTKNNNYFTSCIFFSAAIGLTISSPCVMEWYDNYQN